MSLSLEDIATLQDSLDTIAVKVAQRTAQLTTVLEEKGMYHNPQIRSEMRALRDATAIFATLASLQITEPVTNPHANVPMP